MRICLGEESGREALDKIGWIKHMFSEGTFKITVDGFLFNEYFVTFPDEKHETLFRLKYPQ